MTLARISAGTERCGDPTPQPRQAGRAEPEDPEQKCLHLRHVYAAGDTLTVPLWRENGSFKTIWAARASDAGLYLCSDTPLWGSGPGHRGRLRVTSLSVINFSVIDLSSVAGKPETPADRLCKCHRTCELNTETGQIEEKEDPGCRVFCFRDSCACLSECDSH